jgi:hypothetical protein
MSTLVEDDVKQYELEGKPMDRILARTLATNLQDQLRDVESFPCMGTSTLVSSGGGESEDA